MFPYICVLGSCLMTKQEPMILPSAGLEQLSIQACRGINKQKGNI